MSVFLQIAIPLFITFAALAVIAVIRRCMRMEVFVIGIIVLSLAVGSTVAHIHYTDQQNGAGAMPLPGNQQEVGLMLADQYMLEGLYAQANDILQEMLSAGGDAKNVLLSVARCLALEGRYAQAIQTYQQIDGYEDELELVVQMYEAGQHGDDISIQYLEQQGVDTSDLNLIPSKDGSGNIDRMRELIHARIDDQMEEAEKILGNKAADVVDCAAQLTQAYDRYLLDPSTVNAETIRSTVKKFNRTAEKSLELYANPYLRMARLKGYMMSGDYESLAAVADRYATTEELIVLSQLFARGLVEGKDFHQDYVTVDEDSFKAVLQTCRQTLKELKGDLSKAEYARLEEKYETLRKQLNDPVACTLRQDLSIHVAQCDTSLTSKTHLARSMLEHATGTDALVEEYFFKAIETASSAEDTTYGKSMGALAAIVTGVADASASSQVQDHVQKAVDNSLPLDATLPETTPEEGNSDFVGDVSDTVNQSTAKINIGQIEKDGFPSVTAKVQIQSNHWVTVEELRQHLLVYDCEEQITEFTLEKVEYDYSRIVLLCDVSGSMDGSEQDLKDAIIAFAENMKEGEEVCVIGFDSRISFTTDFTSDPEVVKSYAELIDTGGGTALYDAVLHTSNMCDFDLSGNNVIIAMTDGQDNYPVNHKTMHSNIHAMTEQTGVTLYTLGLGDSVDAEYLSYMAVCGNGSYLFVSGKESLTDFYNFLHDQIAHQYILSFEAVDEVSVERVLKIGLDDELCGDSKTYYLVDPDTLEKPEAPDGFVLTESGKTVSGLDTKVLQHSDQEQLVQLRGKGFVADDTIKVILTGDQSYMLKATFVDSETYQLVIPSAIACDTYDVKVIIGKNEFTLTNELYIYMAGTAQHLAFGDYIFTSRTTYTNDSGNMVLSGEVVMNNWLCFRGDLEITYDPDGSKIWLRDEYGCYVDYDERKSYGLALDLAHNGIGISFKSLGNFYLSNDEYSPDDFDELDDFDVDKIRYTGGISGLWVYVSGQHVNIYPDCIRLDVQNFGFEFPNMKQILQELDLRNGNLTIGAGEDETEVYILFVDNYVHLQGQYVFDDKGKNVGDILLMSLPLDLEELTLKVDTSRGNYDLEGEVGVKMIPGMDGVGLHVALLHNKLNTIGLQLEGTKATVVVAPVPVTFEDFGFEIGKLAEQPQNAKLLEYLWGLDYSVLMEIEVGGLSAVLPDLGEILDDPDISLVEFDDVKCTANFKDLSFAFESKVNMFGILELGKCKVKIGNFSYDAHLLRMCGTHETGFQLSVNNELSWATKAIKFTFGGEKEITVGWPYTGLYGNNTLDIEKAWYVPGGDVNVKGEIQAGVYQNSSNSTQFSVYVKYTGTRGQEKGFHAYITHRDGFEVVRL